MPPRKTSQGQPASPANPPPPEFRKIPINEILPDPKNPRRDLHAGDPEYHNIQNSIDEFGFVDPIIIDTETREVIGGHQRLTVLRDTGVTELYEIPLGGITWLTPDIDLKQLTKPQRTALNIALNKITGDWDTGRLVEALESIKIGGLDITITGFGLDDLSVLSGKIEDNKLTVSDAKKTLSERFGIPPFSVLDARQGYWQDRKRAWIALGIRSEIGRGENALGLSAQCSITVGGAKPHPDSYQAKKQGKPLLFKNAAVNEKGLNHYRNKEKGNA